MELYLEKIDALDSSYSNLNHKTRYVSPYASPVQILH
jgi:hypothetical protein